MSVQCAIIDRVVFVRWSTQPNEADVAAFDEVMGRARQSVGKSMIHVALIAEGIELPPVNIQRPLIKRALKLRATCESMHAVLEGRGVMQGLGRRFLRGLARMFGITNGFVHASAEEALKHMMTKGTPLAVPTADVLAELKRQGMLV